MSLKSLQDYTFISKYSRWLQDKNRRETWNEAVIDRVKKMMYEKYIDFDVKEEIDWAYDLMLKKRVLGSQRALQFGGDPVLQKNCRIYNCTGTYIDRPRVFQEYMYMLLCGCGVGFSVQQHHIEKLPNLVKGKKYSKTFVIEDSIEGWSDAIGVLINSYFNHELFGEYNGRNIDFDFSKIRPAGANLSSAGKAPGPKPLKKCLEKIKYILDESIGQEKLNSIQVYDILMHAADAVISGGVRRSATICIFSKNDQDMLQAKTGNWIKENPQRGRSNNSALLLRDSTSKEEFSSFIQYIKQFGEPGFYWATSTEELPNPCQPSWAKILTPNGIRTIGDLKEGDKIWSEDKWVNITKKWSTGIKNVYKYTTTSGVFFGTEQHKIVSNGEKIKVDIAESIDIFTGPYSKAECIYPELVMDGLVLGGGSVHKASNNLIYLTIGKDDQDYFNSEIKSLLLRERNALSPGAYEITTDICPNELPVTYDRKIPDRYLTLPRDKVFSFLRGIYSANGSVCDNRITLKSTSINIIEEVQLLLSSVGIRSYYTTNKSKVVKFENGDYRCKQSYDLNISSDRNKFIESIGFIQKYKNEKILSKHSNNQKTTYEIISKELISNEEVYDITVDGDSHTYWTQGCNVSNCVEIGFYCYDSFGNSGIQMCNLSTINSSKCKTVDLFHESCKAASIIGTLQAGYTNFSYLGSVTEEIVRRESLIGVSMTGIMENSEICLNPDIQKSGAHVVKQTNKEIAEKININQAARTTCCKPEGTASCLLGTTSGIHPHHAKRYIRRVQANKQEDPYKYFKSINPIACEDSVWSTNNSDDVISFCVEIPDGSKTKNQVDAITMLEYVKSTQINWVMEGKNKHLCTKPFLEHNVSNTIHIKPNEWELVTDYIYSNKKYFTGISLLSISGDKDYAQAPFTTIYLPSEIAREYGDGSLFVSGLIQKSLELFDDDLWKACEVILQGQTLRGDAKKLWKTKCINFAEKYFSGDIKKFTYCMKDVYNYKLWTDLNREYKDVDYTQIYEEKDNTNFEGESACSGGACEII